MIEVHVEQNRFVTMPGPMTGDEGNHTIGITAAEDNILEEDEDGEVTEPVVITDQRVHFATFDAPISHSDSSRSVPTDP